jgi:hypothetical protein
MGQILHGCATTTKAVRRAIQDSQELWFWLRVTKSIRKRWRSAQANLCDGCAHGPKEVRSTVLSVEEEAAVVAFQRHTLLPLDDCLHALQASISHLTRSSLHRRLQRQAFPSCYRLKGARRAKKFKQYPMGYFHIDIIEVQTQEGKLYLFVAIDRTSKFAYTDCMPNQTEQCPQHSCAA